MLELAFLYMDLGSQASSLIMELSVHILALLAVLSVKLTTMESHLLMLVLLKYLYFVPDIRNHVLRAQNPWVVLSAFSLIPAAIFLTCLFFLNKYSMYFLELRKLAALPLCQRNPDSFYRSMLGCAVSAMGQMHEFTCHWAISFSACICLAFTLETFSQNT